MVALNPLQQLEALAQDRQVFRGHEAVDAGVPWVYLSRAVDAGRLVRLARGLYAHPDHRPSQHASLADAVRFVPEATVALLSALRFHGLTTQNPEEVWLLLPRGHRRPTRDGLNAKVVTASGAGLRAGVEEHDIDGVQVPITSVAKTICDCFRYRRLVGKDVAIEALREALGSRRVTPSEVSEMARSIRVGTVIEPILEALA